MLILLLMKLNSDTIPGVVYACCKTVNEETRIFMSRLMNVDELTIFIGAIIHNHIKLILLK